jgi:putative membrane protein
MSNNKPRVFRADDPAIAKASVPTVLEDDPTLPVEAEFAPPPRRFSAFGALVWSAVLGLITLSIGAAAYDLVTSMAAKNVWLGRLVIALGVIVLAGLALFIFRELAALSRISKVDDLRRRALDAWETDDRWIADQVRGDLESLYRNREDFDRARQDIALRKDDAADAATLLTLVEVESMRHLDTRAADAARRGARSVAAATALLPSGVLDAVAVLYLNVRMVREIAVIYGGRAGWLGSWRLLKQVAYHLAATGMIALGEDFFGAVLGGGALAKLSRRAGEGAINGALTARIGVAAMDVCRPLPFRALEKPNLRSIAASALTRFRDASKA